MNLSRPFNISFVFVGNDNSAHKVSRKVRVADQDSEAEYTRLLSPGEQQVVTATAQRSFHLRGIAALPDSSLAQLKEVTVPLQVITHVHTHVYTRVYFFFWIQRGSTTYMVTASSRRDDSIELQTSSGDAVIIDGIGSTARGWVLQTPKQVGMCVETCRAYKHACV